MADAKTLADQLQALRDAASKAIDEAGCDCPFRMRERGEHIYDCAHFDLAEEINRSGVSLAAHKAQQEATGDVWLAHDDDLRFVARVLSGGLQAPEEDIAAARKIVHGLRTTARLHVARPSPAAVPRPPITRQQLREGFHALTGCTLGGDIELAERVALAVEKHHGIPPAVQNSTKEGEHGD